MKIVVQRVSQASVSVNQKAVAKISHGFLVLLGITHDDSEKEVEYLVNKLVNLRVFGDNKDKMNLSIKDSRGSILVVSQFTLYADCKKGNRPSFVKAALPQKAEALYDLFITKCKEAGVPTQSGQFGAMMAVELTNDGPVTIILEA
jgi:D-tyrosyl-tRNA(Tyr) deacylase